MSTSTQNRNTAYFDLKDRITEKEKRVYNVIKTLQPCTSQAIATYLSVPINQVTGRIKELQERCLIKDNDSRLNKTTGKKNTQWMLTSNSEQRELAKARYRILTAAREQLETDYHEGLSEMTIGLIRKEQRRIDRKIKMIAEI